MSRIRNSNVFIPELSLVAMDNDDNKQVGHILLSKIKIKNEDQVVESLALAPVSVLPEYQNQGVGKLLISKALQKAKELRFNSVVVLGHPEYFYWCSIWFFLKKF